ncbi:MAG: flagellar basal-body rod protein FlgF [Pseudomonadota bacterium]|jgi:flagellar basal body rod protein FlgG
MSRELYTAYSGASLAWRQLEVVANNVANANTPGFREARMVFQLAPGGNPESPLDSAFAEIAGMSYNTEDGTLVQDNVRTHLAVRGDGFFALEDGTYTRDGGFLLSRDGELVTREGTAVLGEGGTIRLDPNERFTVSAEGTVVGATSGEVGRIRLVRLRDASQVGGNRWTGTESAAEDVTVMQGVREGSNADPMRAMVELIEAQHYFEAQQKAMQTSDEMQSRLNRVAGG